MTVTSIGAGQFCRSGVESITNKSRKMVVFFTINSDSLISLNNRPLNGLSQSSLPVIQEYTNRSNNKLL